LICIVSDSKTLANLLSESIWNMGNQAQVWIVDDEIDSTTAANTYFEHKTVAIQASDIILTEVSEPHTEIGFVISYALQNGKKVGYLYHAGSKVTPLLTDNSHPLLTGIEYKDSQTAITRIQLYLRSG
jgi:hypothetical protein